jgi:hypothetical protein
VCTARDPGPALLLLLLLLLPGTIAGDGRMSCDHLLFPTSCCWSSRLHGISVCLSCPLPLRLAFPADDDDSTRKVEESQPTMPITTAFCFSPPDVLHIHRPDEGIEMVPSSFRPGNDLRLVEMARGDFPTA